MTESRPRALLLALLASGAAASGQVTSPPPVCFAFNDAPAGAVSDLGVWSLTVFLAAPVTTTITRLDIFESTPPNGWLSFQVFLTDPLTGAATGPALTAGAQSWIPPWWAPAWKEAPLAPPLAVASGTTYAVVATVHAPIPNQGQQANACGRIGFVPAGGTPVAYASTASPYCANPGLPASGQLALMMRFRGAACAPGPLAAVASFGSGCPAAPAGAPYLVSYTPPAFGTSFTVGLGSSSPAGTPHSIFWSIGVNPAGAPLTGGCTLWLDPLSLQGLLAAGLEPLFTGTGGSGTYATTIPAAPALAGAVIGLQGLVLDPAGIPLAPGVNGNLTNGLALTLGY